MLPPARPYALMAGAMSRLVSSPIDSKAQWVTRLFIGEKVTVRYQLPASGLRRFLPEETLAVEESLVIKRDPMKKPIISVPETLWELFQ